MVCGTRERAGDEVDHEPDPAWPRSSTRSRTEQPLSGLSSTRQALVEVPTRRTVAHSQAPPVDTASSLVDLGPSRRPGALAPKTRRGRQTDSPTCLLLASKSAAPGEPSPSPTSPPTSSPPLDLGSEHRQPAASAQRHHAARHDERHLSRHGGRATLDHPQRLVPRRQARLEAVRPCSLTLPACALQQRHHESGTLMLLSMRAGGSLTPARRRSTSSWTTAAACR